MAHLALDWNEWWCWHSSPIAFRPSSSKKSVFFAFQKPPLSQGTFVIFFYRALSSQKMAPKNWLLLSTGGNKLSPLAQWKISTLALTSLLAFAGFNSALWYKALEVSGCKIKAEPILSKAHPGGYFFHRHNQLRWDWHFIMCVCKDCSR